MNWKIKYLLILACLPILQSVSCSLKMQDAGFDPSIKTVYIANIENKANLINPLLTIQLQEGFKQKIADESPLKIVSKKGDQAFYIVITGYTITPIAPKPGEFSTRNRLTVSIDVESEIANQEDKAWKSTFSKFAEFDASIPIQTIEQQLISEIIIQLTDDIYRKAFVNW